MWSWLLLIATLILVYLIYNRFFHPLARVPGPFLAGATSLWLAWQGFHLRRPTLDVNLHKLYGPVVRIAPNEVIFSNPAYFKQVYGAGTAFTKGVFYETFTDGSDKRPWEKLDMLVEPNRLKLHTQKRLLGPVYATANVKRHENKIDACLGRWRTRLEGMVGRPVDFYHEIELLFVDVQTEVTFAEPFGAVERGSDGGHMATMWSFWKHWGWIAYLPWLSALERRIFALLMSLTDDPIPSSLPVFAFAVAKLKQHAKLQETSESFPPCILEDLRALSRQKPEFCHEWGTSLAFTALGAGVDTMSQTLSAVVNGIAQNTEVYRQVRAELDRAISAGVMKNGQPVSYDAAVGMEYLQACIYEAMRLWPIMGTSLPRRVPAGGMEIDGYFIPQGCTVGINPRQLGRSEEVFGPETESFRPRRWLDCSKQKRHDMETRNLAFGGPSRKCPGMHWAWVVVSKTIASLMLEFDVRVLNELNGEPGPGGERWVEEGTFPQRWLGWEVQLEKRSWARRDPSGST